MAGAQKTFMAIATTLVILAALQTHALTMNDDMNVNKVVATGKLFCSANGADSGGSSPMVNAKVDLRHNGTTVMGSAVTDANGSFNIIIIDWSLRSRPDLKLEICVDLPVATCPTLSSATGDLEGVPVLQRDVVNGVATLGLGTLTHVVA